MEEIIINNKTLNKEEKDKISIIAKSTKFNFNVLDLYKVDKIEKITLFCNAYRFLEIISRNLDNSNIDVLPKLKEIITKYDKLYNESNSLLVKNNLDLIYGKRKIMKKAENICITYVKEINELLDVCFTIGRQVREFSADEEIGVY